MADSDNRSGEDRRQSERKDRREGEQVTVKKLFHDYGFKEEREQPERRAKSDRRAPGDDG